ncbi:hypothetical protein [Tritonibacter scottomollicae]|uniref:Uncharacterized protein n=1 Tax=Tritonibacter scottomollicae TaxID=483013 RepID=A0A2T1AAL1_TRISK|nr:hypothetical protein [Tritonibacter scottomollicae]PRZ45609.1 hypothetical protein CLV89_11460 [Tritonibacter scottomollicae]
MKPTEQQPILPGHSWAKGWASLGQSRATAGPEAISTLKNRASQVAASDRLAKRQFCQLNQRIALIAASLRYVWDKSEAPGPKPTFQGTQ